MIRVMMSSAAAALAVVSFASFYARAADEKPVKIDWKACEKEVKEFACKGTDKEIWQCLEKHDEKLSETCDKEHAKGDKLFE